MNFRTLFLISLFAVPLIVMWIPGIPVWLARTIAVCIIYFGGTAFFSSPGWPPA